jgi:predicted dehydrogenase
MTVRIGVIGLGVGERHIEAYREHPDAEVVALCDFDEQRLAEVAARHGISDTTPDAAALLARDDLDLVSVASWDDAHHAQVCAALDTGKHVFVEKPLCQTEEHARDIADRLAAHPGLRLSSNLPLRRIPRFQLLREWVRDGRFGRIFLLEGDYDYGRLHKLTDGWRGDLDHYSIVAGGGVHLIDLLLWMTGGAIVEVTAMGTRMATEGTKFRDLDTVVAVLRFADGAIGKLGCNFACVHPHYHGVRVYGTEASFVNALSDATLWTRGPDGPVPQAVGASYPRGDKGQVARSMVDAVLGRGEPEVSERDILDAMAVVFAIERALVSGQPEAVRPFTRRPPLRGRASRR